MPTQIPAQHPTITGLRSAQDLFAAHFASSHDIDELLVVAHLSDKRDVLRIDCFRGGHHHVEFPVRQLIADIVRSGTAAILIAHNHPSGDPHPSLEDCGLTRRLAHFLDALGCRLLDHLVFAGPNSTSFRALGLM